MPTSKEVGTYLAMCTYSDLIGIHDVTLITATMPRKSYSYVLTLSRQNLFIFVGPLKILVVLLVIALALTMKSMMHPIFGAHVRT